MLRELRGLKCPLAKYVIPLYVQQKRSHSCQLMTTIALDSQLILRVHDPLTPPLHDYDQRYTLRDGRPSTAACPACWEMGTKGIEKVYGEEKNILYWAYYSSLVNTKISCIGTTSPTNQPRKPFHLSSLSPHSTQFQQLAGATPL
jgi:hypothetical protein